MSINKHYLLAVLLFFTANSSVTAVEIQSRIDDGDWKSATAIYPLMGQEITLKVAEVPGATIRWYQIFPDLSKFYQNAGHFKAKDPYKWRGFDEIGYDRREITQFHNQWEIRPFEQLDSTPRNPWSKDVVVSLLYKKDVGSFWFQVEIETEDQIIRKSPGIEDSNKKGLSPKVFRVSIREGEGYLGYLTSYFNVPAVFGSVTYQSDHYIGVDCADILVSAYSKWTGKRVRRNYNVAMLVKKLPKRGEFDLVDGGTPTKTLTWGKDVRPGDFLAVRYPGEKQYQHIAALSNDANNNGVLDEGDRVLHAGLLPLSYSYLEEGYFDGHVVILRPTNRLR
jgi:hypothetical protein